jgi:spore germination protein
MIFLTIYTVRKGDSLYAIANKYGVTVDALIYDNQIANPRGLVEGQALFIPATSVSYRVRPGDSLFSIARTYSTTVAAILAANPGLSQNSRLYPGQVLTISQRNEILGSAHVNGFTVTASATALRESYPALTYVSVFSWMADASGGITPVNDDPVRSDARAANVAPVMTVTNIRPGGGFSSDIAHAVLTNETAQSAFLTNIVAALRQRNYYGVIFDIEYIYPYDRESYNQFLRRAVATLHALG